MAINLSNIASAFKDTFFHTTTQVGLREAIAKQFPGAQTAIDSVTSFFGKLRQLHQTSVKKTDATELDRGEFHQEVKNLKKAFTVSLNPFHYIWAFVKSVFGISNKENE